VLQDYIANTNTTSSEHIAIEAGTKGDDQREDWQEEDYAQD
jgi:hypothetical protein